MKCNVGTVDSLIRIIIGIGIILTGIVLQNPIGLVGILPLITGILHRCILYLPFELSTAADQNDEPTEK